MLKSALFFILVLFASCSQQAKKDDNVFAVSNLYERQIDSLNKGLRNNPPPPPFPFYISNHFIVDSLGQMFYYQLDQRGWFCGTGYDYNVPLFLGLSPNDLTKVPEERIQEFIKQNILNGDQINTVIYVGLLKDTVVSNGLAKLRDVLEADTSKTIWYTRKATLEEATVLDYKKNKRDYSYKKVNWDSTRIRF